MPAQQDRMAERLLSVITRKSNVNELGQRPSVQEYHLSSEALAFSPENV
jgi:hypothetical protein